MTSQTEASIAPRGAVRVLRKWQEYMRGNVYPQDCALCWAMTGEECHVKSVMSCRKRNDEMIDRLVRLIEEGNTQ